MPGTLAQFWLRIIKNVYKMSAVHSRKCVCPTQEAAQKRAHDIVLRFRFRGQSAHLQLGVKMTDAP